MDNRSEIRDFLATRRARISPEQAGLQAYGGNRRVAGLRREEVAMLAGVSVDYYTRLERGHLSGVSDSVLDALARALQLDEAERAHLFDLAKASNTSSATAHKRRPTKQHVRPGVQRVLDAMAAAPAYVRNGRLDVLAANQLGRAVFAPLFETTRDPYDRALTDLIGELSTRSEPFRLRWAAHNVRFHRAGVKHLHHPVVGDLTLAYESMELTADAGLRLNAYSAEPGSPSADALTLLASWTATSPVQSISDSDAPEKSGR